MAVNFSDVQRISIGILAFLSIILLFCCLPFLIWLLYAGNIYIKMICIVYLAFYIYDLKVADNGGRIACQRVRNWGLWKWCHNYFPVDLVKTVDLPPNRNYLICIFPHGYLSIGAFLNFSSNYSKWSTLFPGIRPRLSTLVMNFYNPIGRELYLSLGMSSVSAKSLTAMLKQSNDPSDNSNRDGFTSSAVGLIVGGEREQRYSEPNSYKFVLTNRKGFVRIALKTGVPLVPAISFGESNTFEINSWRLIRFNGRVPITTVVGAPIDVQENPSPSEDEVNEVHELFCERIRELFEEQKSKYVENYERVQLEFV